jgi:hypothetical protein
MRGAPSSSPAGIHAHASVAERGTRSPSPWRRWPGNASTSLRRVLLCEVAPPPQQQRIGSAPSPAGNMA